MSKPRTRHGVVKFNAAILCIAAIACITACGDPVVSFGPYDRMHGGGYTCPVSKEFGRAETKRLFNVLNSPSFHRALSNFNCGDPIENYRFAVALHREGRYSERRVDYMSIPDVPTSGRSRCLSAGIAYLWTDAVTKIDLGSPINYHYRDPSGREFTPEDYRMLDKVAPICDCGKRDGKEEWVTYPRTP